VRVPFAAYEHANAMQQPVESRHWLAAQNQMPFKKVSTIL
jgi:hypothetical protein